LKKDKKKLWGIPKGGGKKYENILETSIREFKEETGIEPKGPYIELGKVIHSSGKIVYAFAFEGEYDGKLNCTSFAKVRTNTGEMIEIPEVDEGEMFTKEESKQCINPAQFEFIERLELIFKERSKISDKSISERNISSIDNNVDNNVNNK